MHFVCWQGQLGIVTNTRLVRTEQRRHLPGCIRSEKYHLQDAQRHEESGCLMPPIASFFAIFPGHSKNLLKTTRFCGYFEPPQVRPSARTLSGG